MQEIRSSFFKFDEDKSQRLEYGEFKRCLRVLGFDVGPKDQENDLKFQAILDIIDLDRYYSV
jgi:Ca2+-binding EF-hand superfamily protein